MLLLATTFWALSFPMMKSLGIAQQKLLPEAGTWFLTWLGVLYRFGIAGCIMALVLRKQLCSLTKLELEQGMGLAVFGAGGILFQMDGLAYTAASTSAFLTQAYVVFIPIWVAATHRRWPAPKVIASVMIVVIGLAILAGVTLNNLKLGRGESETLICSLLFTGQILWLERPRYAGNRPLHFSTVMFLGMALLCLPGVLLTAPDLAACFHAYASLPSVGFMAVLIVVCTLGGYLFMNRWQRDVTATEAGMIYCIEPVIVSVLSLFLPACISTLAGIDYPNESITTKLILGGGLVTMANVLLHRK